MSFLSDSLSYTSSFESDSEVSMQSPVDADSEYAPQLEKDYCSNFVCCGLAIADLHELVSHFEENHVTIVSPDGVPLPSHLPDSPTDGLSPQTASSLESPHSTYASTPPPPNLFPTLTSAFHPRESAFEPVTTSSSRDLSTSNAYTSEMPLNHLAKEEQYVFDAMLDSEAYDCNTGMGYQAPLEIRTHSQYCLSPAQLFPFSSGQAGFVPNNRPAYHHPPTIAPTPIYARPPTLSIITDPHPEQPKSVKRRKGENVSWTSAAEPGEALPSRRKKASVAKQRTREKAYPCPHAGCIKSYMNMNGLKYHLTKGACDFGSREG